MKNLKKVLALALAIALSLTMFAGAAFTDQEEINKTEAVDTLVALGVINGMPDGSFNPDGNVTRAEMAKMIYAVRMRGNTDAGNFAGLSTSFTDLYDTWYRGYVKWAQAAGIIDGKSATTFDPNGSVTGTEAAKMLLVLAGYTSDRAGLTGVNWETNTIRYASQAGLLDNMDNVDLSQALPREYAAQLIYNALFIPMVRWSNDSQSFEEITNSSQEGDQGYGSVTTIGLQYMDLRMTDLTYMGDYASGDASKKGYISLSKNSTPVEIEYTMPNGNEWMFEEVTVLYQDNNLRGTVGSLDSNDAIYGITNSGNNVVYTTTADQLKNIYDGSAATDDKIKFGGVTYDVTDTVTYDINNGAATGTYSDTSTTASAAKNLFDAMKVNSSLNLNTKIKFVCDEYGEIAYAAITDKLDGFGDIVSLSSDKITVRGMTGGTKDIEDDNVVLYDGAAKDDAVYYYTQNASGRGQEIVVAKANVISGKITAITGATNAKTITINGNTYKVSAFTSNVNEFTTAVELGTEYEVVLDGNYWVGAKAISGSDDYAMVIASEGSTINGLSVKMLLADGTTAVYKVHEDSLYTPADDIDAAAEAVLVTYSVTDDGVKLTQVTTPTADTGTAYNSDTKTLTIDGTGYLTNSNAIAFICTDTAKNTWKAYAADDLNTYSAVAGKAYAGLKNNQVSAYSLVMNATPSGVASGDLIGYVIDDGTLVEDGSDYYFNYTVWNGEEDVVVRGYATAKNAADSECTKLRKGNFIKITDFDATKAYKDADSNVTQLTVATTDVADSVGANAVATVKTKSLDTTRGLLIMTNKTWSNATTSAGTDFAAKLDSDYKVIGVNTEDKEKVEGAAVTSFNDIYGSDFANALVLTNGDGEVTHIFIDVNNKISDAK